MAPSQTITEAVDPRVARSRAAVMGATVALLAEHGWSGTTIGAVAERSGVAKTTIYRHWPNRARLVIDAFDSLVAPPAFAPSTDLEADLVIMACSLADALEDSVWGRVLPALVDAAERDPRLASLAATLSEQRRSGLTSRLRAAIDAGDLPPTTDVDLMAHMLLDPLFFRRLLWRQRSTTRFIEALVQQTVRAFRS